MSFLGEKLVFDENSLPSRIFFSLIKSFVDGHTGTKSVLSLLIEVVIPKYVLKSFTKGIVG